MAETTSSSTHSKMYDTLKEKWEKDYITKDTLKGWVALNERKASKGITAAEYEEITGEKYEANEE